MIDPNSCEHAATLKVGPFTTDGGTEVIIDWCRECGAINVNGGRDEHGDPLWVIPVPQTREQLRTFVVRSFGGIVEGIGRMIRRLGEPH